MDSQERYEIGKKIYKQKKFLADTDYLAIKFAEGVISARNFEEVKKQRQVARDLINKYERELKRNEEASSED